MLEHAAPNCSEARGLLWMTRLCAASVWPGDSTNQAQRQSVGIFLQHVLTFRLALGVFLILGPGGLKPLSCTASPDEGVIW